MQIFTKSKVKTCFAVSGLACFSVGSYGLVRAFGTSRGDPSAYVSGPESLMAQKAHGTCVQPVQDTLRYGCDKKEADRICCFNRHYAEFSGYAFSHQVTWLEQITNDAKKAQTPEPTVYYDSVTGKPLFKAPIGRSLETFFKESMAHGWPSFRDEEVIWDNVRVLTNGETISIDGTHLGHNLPDSNGNRYCINLISVAGNPVGTNEDINIDQ